MSKPTAPRAYPEQAPGGWTIEKVRSAVRDLEQGYPSAASRLTRALSRDPRYVQGREQFVGAVQGCPADVIAAPRSQGSVGAARRLTEEAGPMLGRVLGDSVERWLIEWGKVMSIGLGYLTWDTSVRPWVPVSLTRWPLEAVRADMYTRKLYAQMVGGEVEIVPGDATWVAWCPGGMLNWDAALVRVFGEAFVSRSMAGRDLGNRTQAASVAAIVQGLPETGGVGSTDSEAVAYEEKLKELQTGGRAGLMKPAGWPDPVPLDLATKDGTPLFTLSLDTRTKDLLVPWLLQDATATNEGGSLAKAQVLDGVLFSAVAACVNSLWGEERADGSHAPGCITSQIVRPWALFQGAPEEAIPLALRRVPDLDEDTRLKAGGERASVFWAEVETIERLISRPLTAKELEDLAAARGAKIPASVLKERGVKPPPVVPPPVPPPDPVPPA